MKPSRRGRLDRAGGRGVLREVPLGGRPRLARPIIPKSCIAVWQGTIVTSLQGVRRNNQHFVGVLISAGISPGGGVNGEETTEAGADRSPKGIRLPTLCSSVQVRYSRGSAVNQPPPGYAR